MDSEREINDEGEGQEMDGAMKRRDTSRPAARFHKMEGISILTDLLDWTSFGPIALRLVFGLRSLSLAPWSLLRIPYPTRSPFSSLVFSSLTLSLPRPLVLLSSRPFLRLVAAQKEV